MIKQIYLLSYGIRKILHRLEISFGLGYCLGQYLFPTYVIKYSPLLSLHRFRF